MRATITVVLSLMTGLAAAAAQTGVPRNRSAVLSGYVVEAVPDSVPHPLGDAEIFDLDSRARAKSDRYGAFRLEGLSPGPRVLIVRRIGFAPLKVEVTLLAGETTEVDFRLARATELDTILVVAAATEGPAGFLRRSTNGMGKYFTRDQIEHSTARSVDDLLRLSGGVRIDPVTGEAHAPRTEYYNSNGPRCTRMAVMVDGVVRSNGFDPRELSTDHVAGVEIYMSAATLPSELRNFEGAMCGLIAVWTR